MTYNSRAWPICAAVQYKVQALPIPILWFTFIQISDQPSPIHVSRRCSASGAVSNLLVEVSLERQIIEVIARAGPAGISGAQVDREGELRAGERRVERWRGVGAGS